MAGLDAVAIDGPAGAGKSTVARMLAGRMGYLYVSTGLMYRAVALAAIRRKVDLKDPNAMGQVAAEVTIDFSPDGRRVLLDGEDVTDEATGGQVTDAVRYAAGSPPVREVLVARQREIALERPVVMEGRDITTVVLPDAKWKFFLDAGVTERARRRREEFLRSGVDVPLEEMKAQIESRDTGDRRRRIGPLRVAPDAVRIDSTGMDAGQVVEMMLATMQKAAENR